MLSEMDVSCLCMCNPEPLGQGRVQLCCCGQKDWHEMLGSAPAMQHMGCKSLCSHSTALPWELQNLAVDSASPLTPSPGISYIFIAGNTLYLGTQWPHRAGSQVGDFHPLALLPLQSPQPWSRLCAGACLPTLPARNSGKLRSGPSLPPSCRPSQTPPFQYIPIPSCQPTIPRNTFYPRPPMATSGRDSGR